MEKFLVQPEVEPIIHERLTKMGFVKVYSDDKSCYWYEIIKTNLPFFKEIEILYDVETGVLSLDISLSDSSDISEDLLKTFDLDLIEMFLVDCKFINNN
jgi:hypothetical protein